ncbi:MAG: hypothetical protein AAEJ43_09310 [Gammaproteobacteria bacterium]
MTDSRCLGQVIASLILCGLLLNGCARIGPKRIQAGGNDYNIAIQRTADEQLLLNLVRLRYRDTPLFLEVTSVASQFRLQTDLGANATLRERQTPEILGFDGGISFVEQPTVSYAPLQGNDFVQRMLSPIALETISLLFNSGWNAERIFRLCVNRINGVPNAPTASGPTPSAAPEYETFNRIAELFGDLQRAGALRFGFVKDDEKSQARISINDDQRKSVADELLSLLNLRRQETYQVKPTRGAGGKRIVHIETRSLLGIMFYLSHAVQVSESDIARGLVTVTKRDDGSVFDWIEVTQGLFVAHQSSEVPKAPVKTHYRGQWFYLADDDLQTKSTFSLISQLFSLQASEGSTAGPLLTLPVGQ